jgi:hypothetical protein
MRMCLYICIYIYIDSTCTRTHTCSQAYALASEGSALKRKFELSILTTMCQTYVQLKVQLDRCTFLCILCSTLFLALHVLMLIAPILRSTRIHKKVHLVRNICYQDVRNLEYQKIMFQLHCVYTRYFSQNPNSNTPKPDLPQRYQLAFCVIAQ